MEPKYTSKQTNLLLEVEQVLEMLLIHSKPEYIFGPNDNRTTHDVVNALLTKLQKGKTTHEDHQS